MCICGRASVSAFLACAALPAIFVSGCLFRGAVETVHPTYLSLCPGFLINGWEETSDTIINPSHDSHVVGGAK